MDLTGRNSIMASMWKRLLIWTVLLFFFLLIYTFFIEPKWLEVTHYTMQGTIHTQVKIAHITDLHLRKFGYVETKVLRIIKEEAPDIILLTGDILEGNQSIEFAVKFFSDLRPPLGIWGVLGNWENWEHVNDKNMFTRLGIHLLVNERAQITNDLSIFGFDDSYSGGPVRILSSPERFSTFCITLFHSPEFFEKIAGDCPLALAGHTHGGQVRLPLIGPIWLPPGSGNYVSGWYESNGSKLYVSRGLGTSILPVRFMARPEITFITVTNFL